MPDQCAVASTRLGKGPDAARRYGISGTTAARGVGIEISLAALEVDRLPISRPPGSVMSVDLEIDRIVPG